MKRDKQSEKVTLRERKRRPAENPNCEAALAPAMVNSRQPPRVISRDSSLYFPAFPPFENKMTVVVEEDILNRVLRKAAMRYKRKRKKRLYALAKKTLKKSERNITSLKLKLNVAQFGLDNR